MGAEDHLVANLLLKDGRPSCTVRRSSMVPVTSTLLYLVVSTISCMISCISNIRCWRCSLILYELNWLHNNMHNKHTVQLRCMHTLLHRHRRSTTYPMAPMDLHRSRRTSMEDQAPDWPSLAFRQMLSHRASCISILGSSARSTQEATSKTLFAQTHLHRL